MSETTSPEVLLCDTSFVGHLAARRAQPERYEHWDQGVMGRIDAAVLAISVVTIAEVRFGYLKGGWGERKVAEGERRLASFLQIPLDFPGLDEWARIRNLSKMRGISISDNDLWIAATASTRGHPLVTCDKDQLRIEPDLPVPVMYLAPEAVEVRL